MAVAEAPLTVFSGQHNDRRHSRLVGNGDHPGSALPGDVDAMTTYSRVVGDEHLRRDLAKAPAVRAHVCRRVQPSTDRRSQ